MLDPMMTPDSLIAGMRGKNDYFTDGHRERVGINNSYRCFNIQCPAMTYTWLKFQQKTQRGVCVCDCYSENTIHFVCSLFKIGSPTAPGLTKWAKSAGQRVQGYSFLCLPSAEITIVHQVCLIFFFHGFW